MDKYSFLNAASTAFFGDLYDKYLENPDAVEPSWRAFFQGFDFAQEQYGTSVEEAVPVMAQQVVNGENPALLDKVKKEFAVLNLINGIALTDTYSHKSTPYALVSLILLPWLSKTTDSHPPI